MAQSFGFEWQKHHDGAFEAESVFGRSIDEDVEYFYDAFGIQPSDLDGALVLDAGCGSGTLTVELARRHPTATVIGLDVIAAIEEVKRRGASLPNLHVVQGSVFEPPFPREQFDFVWSNGVIHHTGDTRRAFDGLTRRVKPGGRAYLWVYERKISPMVALRRLLMPLGLTRWNHQFLYRVCQVISIPTWLVVRALHAIGGRSQTLQRNTHARILTRSRGFRELVLTWFDVLSPKYRDTYTTEEFESWFLENGFESLKHYWHPVGICGTKSH